MRKRRQRTLFATPEDDGGVGGSEGKQLQRKGWVETRETDGKACHDQIKTRPVGVEFQCVTGVRDDLEHEMRRCDAIKGVTDKLTGFGPRHTEAAPAGIDAPDAGSVDLKLRGCHRKTRCQEVWQCRLTRGRSAANAVSPLQRQVRPRLGCVEPRCEAATDEEGRKAPVGLWMANPDDETPPAPRLQSRGLR